MFSTLKKSVEISASHPVTLMGVLSPTLRRRGNCRRYIAHILKTSFTNGMPSRETRRRILLMSCFSAHWYATPLSRGSVNLGRAHLSIYQTPVSPVDITDVANPYRELTWLRDALIMCNLEHGLREAAGVQHFFDVLHDLWCAHKAFREPRAANSAKSKPPPFESSSVNSDSRLPDIVEATLAAKLSDPDEPMRIRNAIQYLLYRHLFDISMITF